MDRRTFGKAIGAICGSLTLPYVPVEAIEQPLRIHYGLNSIKLTTAFNLEQIFEYGQVSIYENEIEPDINIKIDANIDEYGNRREVNLEGHKKAWEQLSHKRHEIARKVSTYSYTTISIYESKTNIPIPVKDLNRDNEYDIDVFFEGSDGRYKLTLENFRIAKV